MKNFSLTRAFLYAGGALALTGLATAGYAFWINAHTNIPTVSAAFMQMVSPHGVALAAGVSAAFGAGMEGIFQYHRATQRTPVRTAQPAPPRR